MLDTKPCITYGSQCFREHNDLGFGVIGYEDALRVSSNTFFYQVGYGVGVDEIHKVSESLVLILYLELKFLNKKI